MADGVTSVEFPGSTVTLPRKVSYQYDPAGRVIAVYRGEMGSADKYVQSVAFWPGGAEKTTTLGNNVVEETSLNARLQMTGRTAMLGVSTLWGAAYTYSPLANNGNPLTQTVSGPAPFTQTYWYDSLNRLQAVKDSLIGVPTPAPAAPVGVDPATQVFAYDRFGNRALVNGSYSTAGSPVAQASGTPTAAQLEAAAAVNFTNNRTNAYTHDASGNVLSLNGTSTYDGENRLVTATYIPDPTMTNLVWTLRHTYDGDGRRVKTERIKPDGTTVDSATTYVYGAGGELVQEYGSPVVTPGRTYLTGDALGSTRLVTKSGGDAATIVSSRHDYLPFGEEIARGTGFGGGPTQKFTGKERDGETGLDYFGARYMAAAQGRFTSPDPVKISGQRVLDPQQWNQFAYVRGNPLRFIDPDGRELKILVYNSSTYSNGVVQRAAELAASRFRTAGVQNVTIEVRRGTPSSAEHTLQGFVGISKFVTGTQRSHMTEVRPSRSGEGALNSDIKNNEAGRNFGASSAVDASQVQSETNDPMKASIGLANLITHEIGHDVFQAHSDSPENPMYGSSGAPWLFDPNVKFTPQQAASLLRRFNTEQEEQRRQERERKP